MKNVFKKTASCLSYVLAFVIVYGMGVHDAVNRSNLLISIALLFISHLLIEVSHKLDN